MNRAQNTPPALCLSCRKSFTASDPRGHCDQCGGRLVERGYCPVCEGYVDAEPGAPCPKHDVALESGPPPATPRGDVHGPWVEVGRFRDATECQPQRIRLEAEGIPTLIDGERGGSKSMHPAFSGGVVLRVPESLAAETRVILSQRWSDDAETLGIEDDDWDEIDEDFDEPEEPGPSLRKTNPFFYQVALTFIWADVIWIGLVVAALILLAWNWLVR